MATGRAGGAGTEFGPTASGKLYLSRNDHRHWSNDPIRNKWCADCPPSDEFEIFAEADDKRWTEDEPKFLWGIKRDLEVIGTKDEQIAKFIDSKNEVLPWHGYPVSATDTNREYDHRPKSEIVSKWKQAGLISDTQAARILRGNV